MNRHANQMMQFSGLNPRAAVRTLAAIAAVLVTSAAAAAADAPPSGDAHAGHKTETTQPGKSYPPASAPAPEMDHGGMQMQGGSPPPDARDPHGYSGGFTLDSGPYTLEGQPRLRLADEKTFGSVLFDNFEAVRSNGSTSGAYDLLARVGRDYNRLVIKAEGEVTEGKVQEARTEALWSHAIATFWDAQLGVRHDSGSGPGRTWLAVGAQGLAPYWFELDVAAYIGEGGRTALRLDAEYELLVTQRLIVQPRVEANFYGSSDRTRNLGKGLADISAGIRVRYEFTRQFAPYVGLEWAGRFGETADLVRAAGERTSDTRVVAGVRFWF